jgi:non-ribosomal peptide synthetase component E (peptide arylation enzyme)
MRVIRYSDEMIKEFKDAGFWTDETFFDFWAENAVKFPNKEALVDSTYRITWGEAKKQIDSIATHFIESGLEKDDRIIIQSPNTAYGFLARIAAERAGLISLTVYPYMRHRELDYMIERTKAKAVIIPHIYRKFNYVEMFKELNEKYNTIKHFYLLQEEILSGMGDNFYSLIKIAQEEKTLPEEEFSKRRFNSCEDVAILTSTTGTTGIPKLVEWPIAPRLCTSKSRIDLWYLTKNDTVAAIAPHAGGAAGTLVYFAAPLCGAKIVLLEEFTAEAALELMEKEKVTAIGVVPTHLVRMLEKDVEKYDLTTLRFIRSAGGYLPPDVAQESEKRMGGVITSDLGTQDVGSICGCKVSYPAELRRRSVGKPLEGNVVKVLDDDGNELPEGEVGALWFRGPHSPAGYFRDLETTMTVFNEDGWSTTGDLIKWEQGVIWIMGRKKDMIIRGGQNIYPAEIEGLLNEHPAIANVAIVAMPDKELGEKCCAFVVLKAGAKFSFEDMTEFLLKNQLAKFKLPERLEILKEFPTVGDSGKVNKETLKKMIKDILEKENG